MRNYFDDEKEYNEHHKESRRMKELQDRNVDYKKERKRGKDSGTVRFL